MSELYECPFCGGDGTTETSTEYEALCKGCDGTGDITQERYNEYAKELGFTPRTLLEEVK